MRRLHALTALALAAFAGTAGAAEISRVATSGEPGNLFDLDLGVRWDRSVERATITREGTDEHLRFLRTQNAIVPRIAVGLWHDLEAHFEMPYVLGDDREWRYGMSLGAVSGPGTTPSTIAGNNIDANGALCPAAQAAPGGTCALFPVGKTTAGYHGGRAGDLKAGLSWGIFNDRKDDTKPSWIVGMDLTIPTAVKWEPGKGRSPGWDSPYALQTKPGPFGEKIWKWDVYTVLSKRYAYVDPYVKAHARLAFKSASTYSNCDVLPEATDPALQTGPQMNTLGTGGKSNCAAFGSAAGAQLPFVAGLVFGTELVPYEDVKEQQKLSIDLRFFSELTSKQRFYNELTDATGRLHQTEGYMEVGGLVGLYLRASQYVQLQAKASLSTRTAHDLTGESFYRNGWPATGAPVDTAAVNPNFDWRYDAPGRRFRISEVSIFELSFGGVLQF
jgi:hypothetical protein